MKIRVFAISLLSVILLQSCSQPKTISNEEIDTKLREAIAVNNQILVNAMWKRTAKSFRYIGTDRFDEKDIQSTLDLVNPIYFQPGQTQDFTVMDEFYAAEDGTGEKSVSSEKHGYTFKFFSNKPEYYVSVIRIHPNEQQDYLVFAVYNKEEGEWKLDKYLTARYAFYGKNASDMMAMAQNWEKKGFLADAMTHAFVAYKLTIYGGKDLSFDTNEEISAYYHGLREKIEDKYGKFPIAAKGISTAPMIFDFEMGYHEGNFYPAVHYFSYTSPDDEQGMRTEFDALKNYVKRKMPDLACRQRYVFYRKFTPENNDGLYQILATFVDENPNAK